MLKLGSKGNPPRKKNFQEKRGSGREGNCFGALQITHLQNELRYRVSIEGYSKVINIQSTPKEGNNRIAKAVKAKKYRQKEVVLREAK